MGYFTVLKRTYNISFDTVLVAIGGNAYSHIGSPESTVLAAIGALKARFNQFCVSSIYQTPSFPAGSGPDFINAACLFSSALPAADILEILHQIEANYGRERLLRWGQRTLDLDLIAHGDNILPDKLTHDRWRELTLEIQKTQTPDTLILPHPRVQDRAFVLVPLADIAPDWVHPLLDQSVTEMLEHLPAAERAEIRVI
ncbi:MAG: 2-amino-4-hydroxy-6-hydroxymethyldihydropteridine diphosphokinase [Octadecabacter sp.]|nr:2-amino-4-hydroxy-6-hydroxymethyldihydropteridine diphosphokinase [Octadecabacter sp.]